MRSAVFAPLLLLAACSTGDPTQQTCDEGLELFKGSCVDPATRYEPADRLDFDNVVAFGDPLQTLELPDPPKSGFRLIAPPKSMSAGEEDEFCLSWPYPSFTNHVVYAARIYTTTGLHHSNVIAKPVNADPGPNPYPGCNPGASDPFSDLPAVIPDVLFANSTQVVGDETLTFPAGYGWTVDSTREVSTNIHYLNASADPTVVEVAYDFFTMPESELTDEVAPFIQQVNDFLIPPHSQGIVGASCSVYGGRVVSMMPHTHKLATDFFVDFLAADGTATEIFDDGAFDLESDIRVYDPPLDLTDVHEIQFQCNFDNTTDHDVKYGIGENEMCILFGYVTPIEKQWVAAAPFQGDPCQTIQIGLFQQ